MAVPARTIDTEADLDAAIAALKAADPRFHPIAELAGRPPLRRRTDGFAGLAAIIVSQQVSVASADAIHRRVSETLGEVCARAVLDAGEEGLGACGLSRPKMRTFLAVAEAEAAGDIDFAALRRLEDHAVTERLVALKGIGPWSAEIYLLSCLGRTDVWPGGDLALQEAARIAFDLDERPTGDAMAVLAEPWRPWRSVAARLLWSYFGKVRNLKRETGGSV
jgi:DNA-3-methyladenine glycosylase II